MLRGGRAGARPNRGGTPCARRPGRGRERVAVACVARGTSGEGRGDGRPAPRGNVARRYPSTSCHRQSARRKKCGRDAAGLHTATRAACHRPRAPPFASLRARRVARDAPHPLASPPARRRATPVEATRRLSDTVSSGSVAYYPRGGDATTSSNATLPRADTEPTTRYEDGPLDRAAIALFNASSAPPWRMTPTDTAPPSPQSPSPASLASSRSPTSSPPAVALRRPAPGGSRHPPRPHPRPDPPPVQDPHQALGLGRSLVRLITVNAFAWLRRTLRDRTPRIRRTPRRGEAAQVQIPGTVRVHRQLRQFLQDAHAGVLPSAFSVDAHLAPNHEDGSCVMTFGTPPPAKDPAFEEGCYSSCGRSGGCGAGEGDARTPCHRLGEQPGVDGREETPIGRSDICERTQTRG